MKRMPGLEKKNSFLNIVIIKNTSVCKRTYLHSPTSYPGTARFKDWVLLVERR
jgi:hypothetical protein